MLADAPQRGLSVRQKTALLGAILTLASLALSIHRASRIFLFQQAQCLAYYRSYEPTEIGSASTIDESLCKLDAIQHPLSTIIGVDSLLTSLPVWLDQPWTTQVALLSFVFDLIGGGEMVRLNIIITCIAEIYPPDDLTKSYNYISAFYLLANMAGTAVASLLLSHHVYLLNFLSVLCYLLTLCLAATFPTQAVKDGKFVAESPELLLRSPNDWEDPEDSPERPALQSPAPKVRCHLRPSPKPETPSSPTGLTFSYPQLSISRILLTSWRSSFLSLATLFRVPNPTFTVIFLFLTTGFARVVEVLLPQYTSLALNWPLATVNLALSLKSLVSAIILFALPTLRTLYLEPRFQDSPLIDLLVIQASLIVHTIGMIGLGFSAAPALFFVIALCVYTSGVGLADSLTSYGTVTIPTSQTISDFYLRIGLVQTIAGLIAAPSWSTVFGFVLSTKLPLGMPMWISAALFACAFGGTTLLRRWFVGGGGGGGGLEGSYSQI
ncbi:MAG: hypothetical protein Q9190_004429 [Brigantiaea leucoxantha]